MTDNAPVRAFWNDHIHDLDISSHAPGSREFFADLDQYHFEKLHHLPCVILIRLALDVVLVIEPEESEAWDSLPEAVTRWLDVFT